MRINRLQKELKRRNISCAILSGFSEDPNLEYLLGFQADNAFLFIPKKGNPRLIAPKMEEPYLKQKTGLEIVQMAPPVGKQIAKLVGQRKTIGINKNEMIVKEFEAIKKRMKNKTYEDISSALAEIRSVKDQEEVKKLTKACKIADTILKEALNGLDKFSYESEVKKYMIKRATDFGCDVSFDPLVASGKNSSYVHYEDCNKKITNGFFYIDFGVDYQGYKSDITRTIYLGKPSKKEKEMYNNLLAIQKKTIKMAMPGIECAKLDKFVREKLGELSENFTHSLGHGVGIEVHEHPIISSKAKDVLKEGMTLTIEPGIYFPGKFGIRIEDTMLITKHGPKVLTKTPKNYI
mgnify:CR=1 FL=1